MWETPYDQFDRTFDYREAKGFGPYGKSLIRMQPKRDADTIPVMATTLHAEVAAMENWRSYIESTRTLVTLTYEGLNFAQVMPGVSELLEVDAEKVEALRDKALKATEHIEQGFSILHAHSLLGLWGALECFVEDIFKARLLSDPTLLAHTKFAKLKLPVEVFLLSDADRVTAIATEFTRHTSADLGHGISRFERLLEPVNLDGEVSREIRDAIYEAQQIRNVWAHRAGIADTRFCESCPNFSVSVGEKVSVSKEKFDHLVQSIEEYGFLIIKRLLERLNL